jgi:hypothetical protein
MNIKKINELLDVVDLILHDSSAYDENTIRSDMIVNVEQFNKLNKLYWDIVEEDNFETINN